MRKFLLMALLLSFSLLGFAQSGKVAGKVTDETGAPVPFASVSQKGTNYGVSADAEGNFSINARPGIVLVVSATGYGTQEVTVPSGTTNLNVVLTRGEGKVIDEVVVTASGLRINKKEQGYASTTITAEQLTQASPTNVTTALSGKVPGLQINGVSSGVNPSYSIVLRGYRSITGNNQALIVLDNVIVPNSVLGNLNPADIADITTLNGSSAAALYGSRAANGALIVTTKRGSAQKPEITLSQTISAQSVGFYPGIQKSYGSGTDAYVQTYTQYENQQYGPKFDGSIKELGEFPLPGGEIQKVPYAWNAKEGKLNFWKPALTSQTDFSISAPTGGNRGKIYMSAQYVDANGTLEGDRYKRTAVSVGGNQDIIEKINLDYSARYTQNVYNQASNLASIYDLILNSPGQVPLTRYKNWQVDSFAMPNYYYNAYYNNPYFLKDNERTNTTNDYLVSNLGLKYSPASWLSFIGRLGMTSRFYEVQNWQEVFLYNQYAKDHTNGSYKKSDIKGGYSKSSGRESTLIGDFIAQFKKSNIENFDFRANLGVQIIQDRSSGLAGGISGLAVPGLFNLSNNTSPASASDNIALSRTMGLWGELYATYKKYLTLHLTGRRDQVSVLDPEFNKFNYSSADLSFIASDAFSSIKDNTPINLLKFMVSTAKTGNVNIGPYSTLPIFGQASGYPYSGNVGYSIDNRIVTQGLKPEFTYSNEFGFELEMWRSRLRSAFTYYTSKTKNQTLPVSIAPSTGYTSLLTNTGITSARGVEATLGVIPYRTHDAEIGISVNYTYNDNRVDELGITDLDKFRLFSYGNGTGVYAAPGKSYPALYATAHLRDSATGKIIVDKTTGYPILDPTIKYMGRTQPLHRVGVNLDASYKAISLRAVAEYRGSYVIYNAMGTTTDFSGAGINTVMFDRNRFVFPNSVYWDAAQNKYVDNTNITVAEGGPNYWSLSSTRTGMNENYVTSGAFWKLRELALSYELPAKLWNFKVVKGAIISLVGRNLIMLVPKTNVYTDPEYSDAGTGNYVGLNSMSQNPPNRYYGGTITLKF